MDQGEDFDFANIPQVKALLEHAFEEYEPKTGGRTGRPSLDGSPPKPSKKRHREDGTPKSLYTMPGKFNFTNAWRILQHILKGSFIDPAARAAGVGVATMNMWLKRGREDAESDDPKIAMGPHAVFAMAFDAFCAISEQMCLNTISKSIARGNVASAQWLLSKRWNERWSPAVKTDVTSNGETIQGGIPTEVKIVIVDEAEETARVSAERAKEKEAAGVSTPPDTRV